MRPRLWPLVWLWLAGPGAIETAPSLERAKALAPEAESLPFLDRPDFFDYPDSDQARLLALSQFIGEKPVIFATSGSSSDFFHHILVAALMLAFFFLLFQFCSHM
ncbi:fertilization-influencing membrane protein [Trichechus manatus latirostris]|uniref:Fertilization-influencing membrane protein n=1 Tax=Trichechus manatus latirostris TaxID=127582 RepID=A0A2Y9E440_TRIMA|nr:fertilization-influencing membrane protein [Trichechus manatus latirostris]